LLPRLAATLDARQLTQSVPPAAAAHLKAATLLAAAQATEVRREVEHVRQALAPLGLEPVLLKGAAYVIAGLPPGDGRLFSDIDILVPKARLPEVEAALMSRGWATTHHSAYDQRYYREWMHELPPMQHIHRHTTLDVHHGILPETARRRPDPALLLAASQVISTPGGPVRVLAPEDMLLHSMAHLFFNEEHSHALRDLSDLDLLIRRFGADDGFWTRLAARARALDLERTLHYGLSQALTVLDSPVPREALTASSSAAPAWPLNRWMDTLWHQVLRTPPATSALVPRSIAPFLLYVRAHWLRMPPWLLARHLFVKAFLRPGQEASAG
jgi:hypothetical protein